MFLITSMTLSASGQDTINRTYNTCVHTKSHVILRENKSMSKIQYLAKVDRWICLHKQIIRSLGKHSAYEQKDHKQWDSHKHSAYDTPFIRKFVPKRFDKFEFIPSVGASGGILVVWNSSHFLGQVVHTMPFAITIEFTSMLNLNSWKLTTVYGPCQDPMRSEFVQWLKDLDVQDSENWLLIGDFNFYRSLEDRNKPGGNLQNTLIFNDIIGHLGLIELPLKGRAFTWSNMQQDPLLEQLDWFFTTVNWTTDYPNTEVLPMAKITSDHIPCKISIGTHIPRSQIFRFENFWPDHPGFFEAVQRGLGKTVRNTRDSASTLAGKLKNVRYELKQWSKNLSNLSLLISKSNQAILFMDALEESRSLLLHE